MKRLLLFVLGFTMAALLNAAEHSYAWDTEFPNHKSQIPSSDFTTADGLFRFTSDKAEGISGPAFGADSKAGLLLRLYADNTLRIESLSGAEITAITFVIGGNGHYKLAELTPSTGAMGDPYLGKDASDSFREYRLFWTGSTKDITFTVGHECLYGIDCAEQGKENEPGTCMTKQIIISATESVSAVTNISATAAQSAEKILHNGQLLIIRGDQAYTPHGQVIK